MFLNAGRVFVYMVHGNWLLNIVAHEKGEAGAVLIRALEPIEGLEIMQTHRKAKSLYEFTIGPCRLTKALAITKELNGVDVAKEHSQLLIVNGGTESFHLGSSHRIGVKVDLPQNLRFYIKGNMFVSKV